MLCMSSRVVTVLMFFSLIDTLDTEVHFRKRPGTTVGVLGGEAHLVWEYKGRNPVEIIFWYNGTSEDSAMGTYKTENNTFSKFDPYKEKIKFNVERRRNGYNFAVLTIVDVQSSDAGNYTAIFQVPPDVIFDATIETDDAFTLEVVEADALGRREVCCGGICYENLKEDITLYKYGDVILRFTKNGHLSSDMYLDVVASSGASCHHVPADYVANCSLGDPATLVNKEFVNMTITYGKNGRQFYTEAFQIKFLTAVTSNCALWKLFVIVLVIAIAIVLLAVLVVGYRWYREKREKPKQDAAYTGVPAYETAEQETQTDRTSAGDPGDDQPQKRPRQIRGVEHLSNVNGHGRSDDSGLGSSSH